MRPTLVSVQHLTVSRPALWLLLKTSGIPEKIFVLYFKSVSCVRINGLQSSSFEIKSDVRQGYVTPPNSFAIGIMDYLLERSVGRDMNGVCFDDFP